MFYGKYHKYFVFVVIQLKGFRKPDLNFLGCAGIKKQRPRSILDKTKPAFLRAGLAELDWSGVVSPRNWVYESTQLFGGAESVATATFDRCNTLCEIVATVFVPDLHEKIGMVASVASSMPLKDCFVFGHSLFAVDSVQSVVVHVLPPAISGLFPIVYIIT